MKEMRRVLALLLCFAMLTGMLPVGALAEEGVEPVAETVAETSEPVTETSEAVVETTQAVVETTEAPQVTTEATVAATTEATEEATEASEETTEAVTEETTEETVEETTEETEEVVVQEDDGVLQILVGSDYAQNMDNVLSVIKNEYDDIDGMLFLGDYADVDALLADAEEYYAFDMDPILVQGDQDDMSDKLTQSGDHDTLDFGAYIINADDSEDMEAALAELKAYLEDKVSEGYGKPVFVLSHLPLHYGTGNIWGRELFDLLNNAGEQGLAVIFVYGQSEDTYLGEGAVYLAKGESICIPESETYTEETLAFTYMNAGVSSENMSVFTFVEGEEGTVDAISVSRYDADGLCLLKAEGKGDSLMEGNLDTCESPAVISLTGEESVEEPVEEPTEELAEEPTEAPTEETEAPEEIFIFEELETSNDATGTPEQEILFFEELEVIVPAAEAASKTYYVLAGGDFQEAGDHANSAANVKNILAQISQKYTTMDGFLFIGDYDCETHNDATETANGISSLMSAVQETYSNINHDKAILVQGNHDYMNANIDATGGHDFDGYAVFVLNEDDYPDAGGSENNIKNLAAQLETWLNNKLGEGYDAPIFITSHLPLAFGPRTNNKGDGKYAKYLFDVLNAAGDNGLNIIFMHGHDHAYGADNYLGGEAIYLAKGDKINIAEVGSQTSWTEETLNFTYMNAGYVGYYNESGYTPSDTDDTELTMTVFAISNDQVAVERYSADGLYNLKSKGRDGYYGSTSSMASTLGLTINETVYSSPQTISLGVVEDYGDIGSYIGKTPEVIGDVATEGNEWTTITAPTPGTEATPGTTTYKYVLDTDGINTDTKYLIVNTSSNGDGYVLTNNNGTVGRTAVTISNGEIIVDDETNINWTFSGTGSGTVANQGRYIYPDSGNLDLTTSGTSMTFSSQNNGAYQLYRTTSFLGTSYRYYVRYNNGWTGAVTRASSSTTYSVYLFAYDSDIVTPGTEATPGTPGLYGRLEGELSYDVANGTSAEDALAAVKEGIAIKYATADDYSDEAEFPDDGAGMTWTLDPNYDPTVAGDYAVTIKFNDTVLGTAEVIVPPVTTYYIAEGNGLYIVPMNTSAADALAAVKAGVTVSSATDPSGSNKTAIEDENVTWNWVDTYDGADSGPYTVEILYDGVSLGTVEVKVDVKYETGINSDWTYIGESEATGGTTTVTYTLDTDGIDYGSDNKYIIVDDNEAIVLNANSSSNGTAHTITISGNTATTTTRDYEYHFLQTSYNNTRYELITKGDGSQYLYQESNGVRYGTRSTVKFQVNHHGSGVYDIHDIDGTNWYIIYNGSWTVTETTSARVRLYKFTSEKTEGGTPGGPVYAMIEGDTVYTVSKGTSATKALAAVKAGITGYTATDANGTGKTALADSDLTWKWKNTYNGNSVGSYWVEISYQGKVLGTVEVKVEQGVVNNYPEYPDEGAVKVNKTATGIDFQSSGIAQVEVSASGVPIKKGADVIVMLDTSSSMTSHTVTGTSKTRAAVLEESLVNLIAQFKTPGEDGQLLDIRVAIADFNGFYGDNHNSSGNPYDRDAADMMSDDISYNANSEAKVYTGDGSLGAGAFIPVEDLAASYTLNYTSGTNYDYAFDAIYQMGTAIKEANGSEDRDLFVIFMSDGAAMQWNYYHSQGASSLWNNWITGAWTQNQLTTTNLNCTTHAYYYDEADHNGDGMRNEHRMANAVKGDPNESYEVIRKTDTLGTPTDEANMYMVPGLGATLFSISFDAQADTNVTEESMDKSIESLASPQTGTTQYYYKVTTADELDSAFTSIGSEIAYAANNARYVDQMGDDFSLQLSTSTYDVVVDGAITTKTLAPVIEILSYDIYTRQDYLDGVNNITESQIGDRKGTSTLLEVVKFSDDGTKAYSNLIDVDKDGTYGVTVGTNGTYTISDADDNIFGTDGVIYAKTFVYNTNKLEVAIDGIKIPTSINADNTTSGSSNVLPAETFYWKMGTVQTSELAMRYYVYLDGSMQGLKEAGSYPTNEFAVLYYDNYLGNPCHKDTVSPVMAWKEANVSYAFYLVDVNGNIIVNQTTGETGSFANKIAVTNPVVYETIKLNNLDTVSSIDVASLGVLPEGYTLYDYNATNKTGATYTVNINSNTTGSWAITSVLPETSPKTTYVMHYDPNNAAAYSNATNVSTVGNDYTHTVVWFAVVWQIQALPDAVVVDYGLPVDISVLTNDMFGENGKLAGVAASVPTTTDTDGNTAEVQYTDTLTGFSSTYNGTYGVAAVNATAGKVRYTLNSMIMNKYEKFAYAVQYTGKNAENETFIRYYYDTVTVIPATTIYFEDSFLTLKADGTKWEDVGTASDRTTQDEDRPGQFSLTDANNIYGYDGVNLNMSTYSMGTAKKVTVNANSSATATFTFYGTGFDVIGMTSNDTGVLVAQVYNAETYEGDGTDQVVTYTVGTETRYGAKTVDTYYGYEYKLCKVTYTYKDNKWYQYVGDAAEDGAAEEPADLTTAAKGEGDTRTGVEFCWVPAASDTDNTLYQVPVLQFEGLPYDKYTVVLTATYSEYFDNLNKGSYDLYLDAIRIYDPANDGASDGTEDDTIEDAYAADGEGWPSYLELRDKLIAANSFDNVANDKLNEDIVGLVFIDGADEVNDSKIADYVSYGPNNEVYLASGQKVAFLLNTPTNIKNVHIGVKSANGDPVVYNIYNIAQADVVEGDKTLAKAGQTYGEKSLTISTSTDMYYDMTGWKGDIIVISNTGESGILSLTNIKSTYTSNPNVVTASEEEVVTGETNVYVTPAAVALTLRSLNAPEIEEEVPETSEPEENIPETTVPEDDVTETTEPEKETEPEVTEPEETEPEETKPEQSKPGNAANNQTYFKKLMNSVVNGFKKLFGGWFR